MDSVGKVFGRLIVGYIAIVQVVNHLGDTTDVESYTRYATSHGFHDGIGKIFFQRGRYKDVYGIIDINQFLFVADIIERIYWEGNLLFQLFGVSPIDQFPPFLDEFRMFLSQDVARFDEVIDPFSLVCNFG